MSGLTGSEPPFWEVLDSRRSHLACRDGRGFELTYGELDALVARSAASLAKAGARRLGFLFCDNSVAWLVMYLSTLRAGHVPLLLPEQLDQESTARLEATYAPDWTWRPEAGESTETGQIVNEMLTTGLLSYHARPKPRALHTSLGLLLSTSGSTGSPKLVRLSYDALQANAASIAEYLAIAPSDRALTTLPSNYSYGLSVIHSHLFAGASLVLQDISPLDRGFVDLIRREAVTSLAGVPTWYQMLMRSGFDKANIPSLRTLTQAGGRLDDRTKRWALDFARYRGVRFFVMYGQTEATARISYVPPDLLPENLDAIGVPVPGGNLDVDTESGELIYRGTNVMMGYAERAEDLARGDDLGGILRTGDTGIQKSNGLFAVTGRLKRFIKLGGSRVSLDDIERAVTEGLGLVSAAGGRDEQLGIWIEGDDHSAPARVRQLLQVRYRIHHSLTEIRTVETLPRLPSGKIDYGALTRLAK